MEEKWNEVCDRLGGKVSKRGEVLNCELPGVSMSFYPNIDRFWLSDHRAETVNIIDIWDVKHVQITPDYIGVVSDNAEMTIKGREKYVRIETKVKRQ